MGQLREPTKQVTGMMLSSDISGSDQIGSLEEIRILSKQIKTKMIRKSLKRSFIRDWKTAGALVNPKGIT